MEEVMSRVDQLTEEGKRMKRTGIQCRWYSVEHVCVHVRVYRPIGIRVIAGGHQNGVALGHGQAEEITRGFLDVGLAKSQTNVDRFNNRTYPVDFNLHGCYINQYN